MEKTGKLAEALALIAGECGVVLKTGDNTHQRYTYASDGDLKRQLQPLYAKHGIAIVPTGIETTWDAVGNRARCRMLVTYTIAHKDGETMTAQAYGEGINNGDKAAYIAQTGAYKYLVRTIFAVPTTDDAEEASPPAFAPAGLAHDDEFTDTKRKAFMAQLGELGHKYATVKHFCEWMSMPKPSTIGDERRAKLLEYLKSDKGRATFAEFMGAT